MTGLGESPAERTGWEGLHRWLAGPGREVGDADALDAANARMVRELRLRRAHVGYAESAAAADAATLVSLFDFLS